MKAVGLTKREEFWSSLIKEMRASGLSRDAFARSKGVSGSSLLKWSRKLSIPTQGHRRRRVLKPKAGAQFIPVEVAEPRQLVLKAPLQIVFPSGHTLCLVETPDARWLAEIMKLIS
jgi:hypothetical protein